MSKPKQTFTDPKTGEEIESTALARWGGSLFVGLTMGLTSGLLNWFEKGLIGGFIFGLISGLVYLAIGETWGRDHPFTRWIHDGIARQQHFHRQRILRRQEFPHVPNKALSRVKSLGQPEPDQASLSVAEEAEDDRPRLAEAVEVEEETKAKQQCEEGED